MNIIKTKLITLTTSLFGIIEKSITTVTNSVGDAKTFLITIILLTSAIDIIFLGKLGFISLLITYASQILVIAKSGGWWLLGLLAFIILYRK